MPTATMFAVCAVLAVVAASMYYGRMKKRHGHGALLLAAIRLAMIAALACAFWEPTLHFTRFTTRPPALAVLVDASQSMRLFKADSVVAVVRAALNRTQADDPRRRITMFCFGDSLRPQPPGRRLSFDDRHSIFPAWFDADELRTAQHLLIVSDGNWSNAFRPPSGIEQKNCAYVVLPPPSHRPFITIRAQALPPEVPLDSVSRVAISISGFQRTRTPIRLACTQGRHTVWRKEYETDTGFYADTILAPLPSAPCGTFLYTISASQDGDSLRSSCHVLQHVVRRYLTARLFSGRPSLDTRFLTLALARSPHWRLSGSAQSDETPDAAFFFAWDDSARRIFERLRPQATAVFVGCIPCDSVDTISPSVFTPALHPLYENDPSTRDIPTLPPPAALVRNATGMPRPSLTLLWTRAEPAQGVAIDTLPLLFEQRASRRRVLVLAAQGLWRWDFWPLARIREGRVARFSDFFLARVHDLAIANMNRSMYAYVETTPVYDTDSLSFRLVVPAYLFDRLLTSVRLSIIAADTAADTLVENVLFGSGAIRFTFPPLPPASYRYECAVRYDGDTLQYADSLHVYPGNDELNVSEQNTTVLNQIAQPLLISDTSNIAAFFDGGKHAYGASLQRHAVHIRQSWGLLALVLLLLASEWFLRKTWRLD